MSRYVDLDKIEFLKVDGNDEFNHGVDCCINILCRACREQDDCENEIEDLHNRLDIAEHDKEKLREEVANLEEKIKTLEQKPCDCISREQALKALGEAPYVWTDCDAELQAYEDWRTIKEMLEGLPSVAPKESQWIPVSERLPSDRDWYLGIFKESDTGWISPIPFVCNYVGYAIKSATKDFWILRGLTDINENIDYYYNLECVAWQPLPKPYRESE